MERKLRLEPTAETCDVSRRILSETQERVFRRLEGRVRRGRPLVLVRAVAGSGKTTLLRSLARRAGGAILRSPSALAAARDEVAFVDWPSDAPPLALAGLVEDAQHRGRRLVVACGSGAPLPGLSRLFAYGLAHEIGPPALFLRGEDVAGLGPAAQRARERSAGWPWLFARLLRGDPLDDALERFLTDDVLARLDEESCALLAAVTRLRCGLRESDLDASRRAALSRLAPLVQRTPEGAWKWAAPALRTPIRRAADAALQKAQTGGALGAYARTLWDHGLAADAITAAQAAGEEDLAVSWLQHAGGAWFGHRYGASAFDRVLSGFSARARATEPVTLALAMRAIKEGRVERALRMLAERFGADGLDLTRALDERAPGSAEWRVFRLVLATYEDAQPAERVLSSAFRVLGLVGSEAHLLRGLFYNAVLEHYARLRRLGEARAAAARALHHYSRAQVPYLEFFIHLFSAMIELMEGRTEPAAAAVDASAGCLRRAGFSGDSDWRIQSLFEGCIAYDRGDPSVLVAFVRAEWSAFSFGELWPSLGELALDYGARALSESASPAEAQAFLDRWQVEVARSGRFGPAARVREILLLQNCERWREARLRLDALGAPPDETLASESDRHRLLVGFAAVRQRVHAAAGDPTAEEAVVALESNPRVTPRQRLALGVWRAAIDRRRGRIGPAAARLSEVLETAAARPCIGPVLDERPFLAPLLADRQVAARLALSPQAARLAARLGERAGPTPSLARSEGLTTREIRVLMLLAEGCTNKQAARELGISEPTVKFHLKNLFRKIGVRDRRAAVRLARSRGWLDADAAAAPAR